MWNLIYKWICILFPIVVIWSLVILYYNAFIFNSDTYYLIDFETTFNYIINNNFFGIDIPGYIINWVKSFTTAINGFGELKKDIVSGFSGFVAVNYFIILSAIQMLITPIVYIYTIVGYTFSFVAKMLTIVLNTLYLLINPIFYDSGIKKNLIAGALLLLKF